jgi:ribonuclease BN (tRNA processing enzyme)
MIARLRLLVAIAFCVAATPDRTPAQRAAAAEVPNQTQILMLGTAGGPPLRYDRSEPATLLIVNGRPYLIDCGIGTARRLVEAHTPSETIGTIFLTHLHADHALGLADVLANDFQRRERRDPRRPLAIYGPPQTAALVDAAWKYISISYAVFDAEDQGPTGGLPKQTPFETHEVDTGVVYHDDLIRVVATENSHYALMPAASRAVMKSYSYRFETPHGVIVFTGDTGPSDAVARLAQGADVLVAEVSDFAQSTQFVNRTADQYHWPPERRAQFLAHMTEEHLDLKDVGELASKAQVGSVLLYHMNPVDPAAYVVGVRAHFSGPVFAGADLERYCFTGSPDARGSKPAAFGRCGTQ